METMQKQIVLGILAHVDSGKTTLSEEELPYRSSLPRYARGIRQAAP